MPRGIGWDAKGEAFRLDRRRIFAVDHGAFRQATRGNHAGTLGAAMMQRFAELKWAARDATPGSRVVNFTRTGEKQFAALFGNGKD